MPYIGSADVSTASLTPSITITTNQTSTILVIVLYQNSMTVTGVSDGTAYTALNTVTDTGSNNNGKAFKRINVPAGTYTITATMTGTNFGIGMWVGWYSNGDVTGTPTGQDNNFPGTGANISTSGSTTPAVNGATLVGFCITTSGAVSPTAGTTLAWTGRATANLSKSLAEDFVQTTAAAAAATFGYTTSVDSMAFIIALAPAAAAGFTTGIAARLHSNGTYKAIGFVEISGNKHSINTGGITIANSFIENASLPANVGMRMDTLANGNNTIAAQFVEMTTIS